jgi:hypothetical protein
MNENFKYLLLIIFLLTFSKIYMVHYDSSYNYDFIEQQPFFDSTDNSSINQSCDDFKTKCSSKGMFFCKISNFTELNFDCMRNLDRFLGILTSQRLIIDNTLKLNIKKNSLIPLELNLVFYPKIDGFDFYAAFLSEISEKQFYSVKVTLNGIQFFLYSNERKIRKCSDLSNPDLKDIRLFSSEIVAELVFSEITKYQSNMCPLVFSNSALERVEFYGFSNHFVKKNYLSFDKEFDMINKSINSSIRVVNFYEMYSLKIDSSILNKFVFENTEKLIFVGLFEVDSDNHDLFKPFKKLKSVEFSSNHFREFLSGDLNWANQIKTHHEKTAVKISERASFPGIGKYYLFPDEDFCFFLLKYQPNQILFSIECEKSYKCSCLIKWLMMNNLGKYYRNCEHLNCSFNEMSTKCFDHDQSKFESSKPDLYDLRYIIGSIDYVLNIILAPLFYTFALMTNFLCFLILRDQDFENDKNQKLFQFMKIHSIVNCFYSVLNYFNLLATCIEINGAFCSPFFSLVTMQYFKIGVLTFLNGVLKTLSILTFVLISIQRLVLLKNDSKFFLNKLVRISIKCLILSIILISLVLNIPVFFHYEINKINNYLRGTFPVSLLYQLLKLTDPHVMLLSVISFLINDVLLFILITAVDLLLVRELLKDMRDKKSLLMISIKRDKTKFLLFKKKLIKSMWIIMVNLSILSVFRLIDLFVPIYRIWFLVDRELDGISDKISIEFEQILHFFFIMPLSYTFVFYILLNVKFKEKFFQFFYLKSE